MLTVHTPLTHEGPHPTCHLLDARRLALLKPDALVINAARGGIIDEEAWLMHAGDKVVDCWENEPSIRNALLDAALLATPHIAGHSTDSKLRGGVMASNALRAYLHLPPLDSKTVTRCLPPAPTPLTPPPGLQGEAMADWAIRQAWDFHQDDLPLRQAEPPALPVRFEDYRRHYPVRREWRAWRITAPTRLEDGTLLKALGFSVD